MPRKSSSTSSDATAQEAGSSGPPTEHFNIVQISFPSTPGSKEIPDNILVGSMNEVFRTKVEEDSKVATTSDSSSHNILKRAQETQVQGMVKEVNAEMEEADNEVSLISTTPKSAVQETVLPKDVCQDSATMNDSKVTVPSTQHSSPMQLDNSFMSSTSQSNTGVQQFPANQHDFVFEDNKSSVDDQDHGKEVPCQAEEAMKYPKQRPRAKSDLSSKELEETSRRTTRQASLQMETVAHDLQRQTRRSSADFAARMGSKGVMK